MIKIEIKNLLGEVAFTWESEKNTYKETIEKLIAEKKGEWIKNLNLSNLDLSGINFYNSQFDNSRFDNSQFYNSRFYNSQFDNSQFYNSQFDNSRFYNSQFDNSQFYNSQFDNSRFDNSQFYNSQFYNSQFDNSQFDQKSFKNLKNSGALESIRFDFFGRLLVLKNEIKYLRESLVNGKIKGTSYDGECCCFIGTAARARNCDYHLMPGIKPDLSSDTECWFLNIKEGDTPVNSDFVKLTIEWIDEFITLLEAK